MLDDGITMTHSHPPPPLRTLRPLLTDCTIYSMHFGKLTHFYSMHFGKLTHFLSQLSDFAPLKKRFFNGFRAQTD